MKRIIEFYRNLPRKMRAEAVVALVLTVLAIAAIPTLAWFVNARKLGDLERVDTPTNLFITAAHDDIKYLQLTDIRVSDTSSDHKYYVFCVSGKTTDYYHLQLAYTTNNQFEYFIYPAKQLTAQEVEAGVTYHAKHTAHDENGNETDTYYYAIETDPAINAPGNSFTGDAHYRLWTGTVIRNDDSHPVQTRYLNKAEGPLVANYTKHDLTYNYKEYDTENNGNGIGAQLYCEPVYWQALRIKSGMDPDGEFVNYYILEVNWTKAAAAAGEAGLKDDKETDIIYIVAEATS